MIEATKAARLERSRLGASGLPLGAAVYRNLVERGVRTTADELDRGWSARQGADGRWLVTLDLRLEGPPPAAHVGARRCPGADPGR